jgi:hypothetical protein
MAEFGWDFIRRSLQMAAMAMGSMTAIVTAWLALGLPMLATREWVSEQIAVLRIADSKTLEVVRSVELEVLISSRDSVEADIFLQEQELKKNSNDPDAARRLRMLRDTLMDLNQKIIDLRTTVH